MTLSSATKEITFPSWEYDKWPICLHNNGAVTSHETWSGTSRSRPLAYVYFLRASRFANWMSNNEPLRVSQDPFSTENGAYNLEGAFKGAATWKTRTTQDGISQYRARAIILLPLGRWMVILAIWSPSRVLDHSKMKSIWIPKKQNHPIQQTWKISISFCPKVSGRIDQNLI